MKATLESFIQQFAEQIKKQTDWQERQTVNASVTLRKRLRDLTDDDRTGVFNPYTNNWTAINMAGIYSWNIVKPTIRANTSSMTTARVKIDIEPRFPKDSRSEMAAQVASAEIEKLDREQWTHTLEELLADEQQLGAGVFVRAAWNPHIKTKNKLPKWSEVEMQSGGEIVCGYCGNVQMFDSTVPESQETIDAQVQAMVDEANPRIAVLLTASEQDVYDGFLKIPVKEGVLLINPQKAPPNIEEYIVQNGYAALLGKAEDLTGQTNQGLAVTTSQNGNELVSSVVQNPQNLETQMQMDAEQFPGAEQSVGTIDDVLAMRARCNQCGASAQVITPPTTEMVNVPTGYDEYSFGASETTAHQFFNFRVDPAANGGDLSKAKWFEHHYLVPVDELEVEYPDAKEAVKSSKDEWSYPLQWQYALQNGLNILDFPEYSKEIMREIRDIFVTPAKYLNFEAEKEFVLKSKKGNRFKAVKNLKDAEFEGEKQNAPVWCFRMLGEHILDVFPCDFREEFFYLSFLINPSSFWALFYTELISLQDIVNYMLTLQMYHIRRNAITSIVYDRSMFNPDDFEEDLIPTREDAPVVEDIRRHYNIIPALTLSAEPMNMMQMVIQGKGDVTQVKPAMVGDAAPGEPYHAQLLQKQQSLGLLAPAELSKATAKVGWAKQQLRLKRKYWTDEDTDELLRLNAEWTEDFIEAFLSCDIDTDLIIDFVEGSEIPRSLIEREIALRQLTMDIAQMGEIIQLAQMNPNIIKPETISDILTRLANAANVDVDINNVEGDLRLAESRYDKLRDLCKMPVPIEQAPALARQIMFQPVTQFILQPKIREGHATQIEYYSDKQRNEDASAEPNFLLICCLQIMMTWCDEAEVRFGQMQVAKQLEIQKPAMMQQQQMQDEQLKQEQAATAQADEQKRLEADESQRTQSDEAQSQRDEALLHKVLDLADKDEERKMKRDLAKGTTE